jgi:hypothetical protein
MSFKSTHCRQTAYIVFALGSDGVDELVLVEEVVTVCLVLLGVLHERCASKLRQLGLLGGPQQHLVDLLRNRRHDESVAGFRDEKASIGLGIVQRRNIGMGRSHRGWSGVQTRKPWRGSLGVRASERQQAKITNAAMGGVGKARAKERAAPVADVNSSSQTYTPRSLRASLAATGLLQCFLIPGCSHRLVGCSPGQSAMLVTNSASSARVEPLSGVIDCC